MRPPATEPASRDAREDGEAFDVVIERLVIELPEGEASIDALGEEIAREVLERIRRLYDEV